jgi:hypothetical protein
LTIPSGLRAVGNSHRTVANVKSFTLSVLAL